MATLSANSRRNSAAAAALGLQHPHQLPNNTEPICPMPPQVPPQSLTAASTQNRMQAVNEEEDADNYDESGSPLSITPHKTAELELRLAKNNKSSACSERSDSGFSESCSSCSGASSGAATRSDTVAATATVATQSAVCVCNNAVVSVVGPMTAAVVENVRTGPYDHELNMEATGTEASPPNGSQTDLHAEEHSSYTPAVSTLDAEHTLMPNTTTSDVALTKHPGENTDITINEQVCSPADRRKLSLSRSFSSSGSSDARSYKTAAQHEPAAVTTPIMKSDFTNTVRMRKQSLEMHSNRDAQPQLSASSAHASSLDSNGGRINQKLDVSGKVSKLMQRYTNSNGAPSASTPSALSPTIRPINPPAFLTSTTNKAKSPQPLKLTHKSMDFRNVRDRFNNIHTTNTAQPGQPPNSSVRRQTPPPLANNTNLIISKLQFHSTHSTALTSLADRDAGRNEDLVEEQPHPSAGAGPAFERTPVRLSGRIRETRDRLCRAAQDSSVAVRRSVSDMSADAADGLGRTGINHGNGQFAKASAFWKS